MILYRTPGRSFTRPPRTSTIECSWRLCPSPPMYAVISLPLESRTRATFRSAEFGFLGVIVLTWRQTPRLNGQASSTGDLVLYTTGRRGLRTSWLIVGMCRSMDPARSRPGCLSLRVGWSRLQEDTGASSTHHAEARNVPRVPDLSRRTG